MTYVRYFVEMKESKMFVWKYEGRFYSHIKGIIVELTLGISTAECQLDSSGSVQGMSEGTTAPSGEVFSVRNTAIVTPQILYQFEHWIFTAYERICSLLQTVLYWF
jgi:hypothetical protein